MREDVGGLPEIEVDGDLRSELREGVSLVEIEGPCNRFGFSVTHEG